MSSTLDRPIWNSLRNGHARFAVGSERALRYQTGVSPFAGAVDESSESLAELGELARSYGDIMLIQKPTIVCPPDCRIEKRAKGVQMMFEGFAVSTDTRPDIVELSENDIHEMRALAELTRPGPFVERTHEMGNFLGIKRRGKLIAMAGERLTQPGFTEVSAVCTHPDHRGEGLAGALSAAVSQAIVDRGEKPYLHAFADNRTAIELYERLGFELRVELDVAIIAHNA